MILLLVYLCTLIALDHHAAKPSGGYGSIYEEDLELDCPRTDHHDLVVSIRLSQRYFSGDQDTEFMAKAKKFLSKVKLGPVPDEYD